MEWVVETELAAYGRRVLPWLERDPVRNTVQATVLLSRLDGTADPGGEWLGWLRDADGAVAGVALRTPPRGLLVSPLPPGAPVALAAVAAAVAGPRLPGAAGPAAEVADFATAYAARTGGRAAVAVRQRLFRLDRLVPATPVPGRLREATGDDAERCAAWYADFSAEAGKPPPEDPAATTRRIVTQRRLLLWEVDGRAVSMVGHTRTVAGVPRVGPVYTPPAHRRRGYAAAATGATCARLLDRGATAVVLFADRANPTSTGVYRRLGFDPVCDHDDWGLEY